MPAVQSSERRKLEVRKRVKVWHQRNTLKWKNVSLEEVRNLTPRKRCCACGKIKSSQKFHRLNQAKDGLQPRCNSCMKAIRREINRRLGVEELRRRRRTRYERIRNDPILLERNRETYLRHKLKPFGISPEEYHKRKSRQHGRCRICRKRAKLFLDHDHTSVKARDFLCNNCNSGIGFFNEDPQYLIRAAQYVYMHKKKSNH